MKVRYPSRRHAAIGVGLAVFLLAATDVPALTVKVGPSAGALGSACQFDNLQDAVDSLPADGKAHTIELEAGTYLENKATIDVDGRSLTVATRYAAASGCATPVGGGTRAELRASQTTLPGGRTVVVRNNGALILESVGVTGNQNGGILVRESAFTIRDSAVSGHSTAAGSSGAGVVIEGGALAIENTLFSHNDAGANGGAVFCTRASSAVVSEVVVGSSSRFVENTAMHGGAIYLFRGCSVRIKDESFLWGNAAEFDGGAIALDPGAITVDDRNVLMLDSVEFRANIAGRDGGAISIAGLNSLLSPSEPSLFFFGNLASRFGGAIDIASGRAVGALGAARFTFNIAGQRGGAISVREGFLALNANCAEGDTVNKNYCALFDGNQVIESGGQPHSGGTFDVREGSLFVIGFAFRNSRGPSTLMADSGGVIGFVGSGILRIANSLIYDTPAVATSNQHLFQLNGGLSAFSFNTMVDLPQGAVIFSQPGASVVLVGNIIAGNSAGVTGGGTLTQACNNLQMGDDEAPMDPRFVTTAGGRYRLAADSPMIGLGLTCESGQLPPDFHFPRFDLDGNERVQAGEQEREMDLGAFEFQVDTDTIFAHGFESVGEARLE